MSTLCFLRRLRPFNLQHSPTTEDEFLRPILDELLSSDMLNELANFRRTAYDEELHMQSLFQYDRPALDENMYCERTRNCPLIEQATLQVKHDLAQFSGTHIINKNNMDEIEFDGTTSAGYGYYGKKADNYELARHNATRALYDYRRYGRSYRFVPDMAFSRLHVSTPIKPKLRHIWGRAFHNILIESLLGQNLLKKIINADSPLYIGKDIHKHLPAEIDVITRQHGHFTYCLDFSSFDASVNRQLLSIAWDILHSLFVFDDPWDELIFDYCKELFINTPVIMPNGKLYLAKIGVPSGSLFTQIVDSIINLILMYAMQIKYFGNPCHTYVCGDDSVFCAPKFIDAHSIAAFFKNYGMKLNADKSVITAHRREVHFLGHEFTINRATRKETNALALLLYPEHPVETPAHSLTRIASLVYDCSYTSWLLYNIYKTMIHTYSVDWNDEALHPVTVTPPYHKLFLLS